MYHQCYDSRARMAPKPPPLDVSIVIAAPIGRVIRAFFDAQAIAAWWHAARSVTAPRMLGPYVIEWAPTDFSDDLLGRLGGIFRGTVMHFEPAHGFFVADAFWLPPDTDPIGPMALEVACTPVDQDSVAATHVRVTQTGFEESDRWRRYYEIVGPGWERALNSMKALIEK